jgi:hypothetical protein
MASILVDNAFTADLSALLPGAESGMEGSTAELRGGLMRHGRAKP